MKLFLTFIIPSIAGGFIIPSDRIFVSTQLEVAGFSGFGHVTGDIETKETSPTPVFTGFGHATGNTKQTESASAPALTAPASVFTGFGHAAEATEEREITPAPVFSGFGHVTGTAKISETAPAPAFSGFGHALSSAEPSSKEVTPAFSGFGHAFAGSENTSSDVTTPEKSPLEEAKAFLIQATEKATKLRDVMKLKENQNGSRIQQLMGDLQKQEASCRSYESQISSISAEFEEYKANTGQEQLALKEQMAKKDNEIDSALTQAKEICDLLDELM